VYSSHVKGGKNASADDLLFKGFILKDSAFEKYCKGTVLRDGK
jgi:hypothetical protein